VKNGFAKTSAATSQAVKNRQANPLRFADLLMVGYFPNLLIDLRR
jgi:hypothetical protein